MPDAALMRSSRGLVRRAALVLLVGALVGLIVGGIGGRLAMMLIANLNPEATGQLSDDGFEMGRFTVPGTLNLLAATATLGMLGAAIYGALRPLRWGPRWFQFAAVTIGPAVVVGSMLVHDGVDFTFLTPVWLSIALFVAIPGVYGALLWLVTERWLPPGDYRLHPALAWIGRAALALVFILGAFGLAADISEFT